MTRPFVSLGLKSGVWEGRLPDGPAPARVALTLNGLAQGFAADRLAEAFREAEELRGDGDARAAAIYAAAYGQDQEFYAFHRSLQAYRESFSSKEDVLVLDPKSDFFRYLQSNK